MGVFKTPEGQTKQLDDETTVRDMQSDRKVIRGPFMVTSRIPGIETANIQFQRKTIVIEDILLDPNDDIRFLVTMPNATTGTNDLVFFVRTRWKVTE